MHLLKSNLQAITLPNDPDDESGNQTQGIAYPIHVGGGWYELSNGEKVQGKEDAEQAQSELDGD